MRDYFLSVPKGIYFNEEITSCEVAVYATIHIMCMASPLDEELIELNRVVYYMHGNESGRKSKETIRAALNNLFSIKVIDGKEAGANSYIVDKKQFKYENGFARIPLDGYRKILGQGGKRSYALFRYYCAVMGSRGSDGFSTMKAGYFMDKLDISSFNTVYSYNEELEKLHLMYVTRGKVITNEQGDICKEYNTYCSYEDRYKLFSPKSMGQKLAQLKRGKKYTPEEVKEIYDYVDAHNEREEIKAREVANYVPHILTK